MMAFYEDVVEQNKQHAKFMEDAVYLEMSVLNSELEEVSYNNSLCIK